MAASSSPTPPAEIRIVLADDHDLVRTGLKALLAGMPGLRVVAEARDGLELLHAVKSVECDLVITDISMPRMDGLTAIEQLRIMRPKLPILVLSMYDTADFVRKAVASGSNGYIMKDATQSELQQAVHSVMTQGSFFSQGSMRRLTEPVPQSAPEPLTPRQLQILTLIASGMASKEIGFKLKLSPKTVDAHRGNIMERLAINDIAGLTLYAVRRGLVQP